MPEPPAAADWTLIASMVHRSQIVLARVNVAPIVDLHGDGVCLTRTELCLLIDALERVWITHVLSGAPAAIQAAPLFHKPPMNDDTAQATRDLTYHLKAARHRLDTHAAHTG